MSRLPDISDTGIGCSDISIVFMGTPEFAVPVLRRLAGDGFRMLAAVTQPDRPSGRHMEMVPPPVKTAAASLGIPVLQPSSLSDIAFADQLKALQPDLIVTAAFGRILPPAILEIPRYCFNIHASLLPKYRGAAPIQWSIFNGDATTGITVMLMDEGMDTGDILYSEPIDILPDMNAKELSDSLSQLGAERISGVILAFLAGRIKAIPQDSAMATKVRPITKEDGRIDWSQTAPDIHNRVRGCYPWPGAFTTLGGRRMKIVGSKVIKELPAASQEFHKIRQPGVIIRSEDKSRLFVVCGKDYLEITSLQLEGCKLLPVKQCAHNIETMSQLC
ncbi:MAG: methionyl-tRNA formyltransferase [Saccharofermentanales bacterium]